MGSGRKAALQGEEEGGEIDAEAVGGAGEHGVVGVALAGEETLVQTPMSVFLPRPPLSPPQTGSSASVSQPLSVRLP